MPCVCHGLLPCDRAPQSSRLCPVGRDLGSFLTAHGRLAPHGTLQGWPVSRAHHRERLRWPSFLSPARGRHPSMFQCSRHMVYQALAQSLYRLCPCLGNRRSPVCDCLSAPNRLASYEASFFIMATSLRCIILALAVL
jgi:hypothetical protein